MRASGRRTAAQLVYRGHGYVNTVAAGDAMSYGNITGGAAPVVGDFVLWIWNGQDPGTVGVAAPSGWTEFVTRSNASGNKMLGIYRDGVVQADLEATFPTMISNTDTSDVGFWIALKPNGVAYSSHGDDVTSSGGNPASVSVDATGVAAPLLQFTWHASRNSGGGLTATTNTMSSALKTDSRVGDGEIEAAVYWDIVQSGLGSTITIDQDDNGSANYGLAGYIQFA